MNKREVSNITPYAAALSEWRDRPRNACIKISVSVTQKTLSLKYRHNFLDLQYKISRCDVLFKFTLARASRACRKIEDVMVADKCHVGYRTVRLTGLLGTPYARTISTLQLFLLGTVKFRRSTCRANKSLKPDFLPYFLSYYIFYSIT